LWHTVTEAKGCNAKESRTPYYNRTPMVQIKTENDTKVERKKINMVVIVYNYM